MYLPDNGEINLNFALSGQEYASNCHQAELDKRRLCQRALHMHFIVHSVGNCMIVQCNIVQPSLLLRRSAPVEVSRGYKTFRGGWRGLF